MGSLSLGHQLSAWHKHWQNNKIHHTGGLWELDWPPKLCPGLKPSGHCVKMLACTQSFRWCSHREGNFWIIFNLAVISSINIMMPQDVGDLIYGRNVFILENRYRRLWITGIAKQYALELWNPIWAIAGDGAWLHTMRTSHQNGNLMGMCTTSVLGLYPGWGLSDNCYHGNTRNHMILKECGDWLNHHERIKPYQIKPTKVLSFSCHHIIPKKENFHNQSQVLIGFIKFSSCIVSIWKFNWVCIYTKF